MQWLEEAAYPAALITLLLIRASESGTKVRALDHIPWDFQWHCCGNDVHRRRKGKEPCTLTLCCQLKCFWLPVTKSPTQIVLNNKRFIIPINKKSRGPSFHSLQVSWLCSPCSIPSRCHLPRVRGEPSFLTNVETFPRSHLASGTHTPMSYWPRSSYMLISKPIPYEWNGVAMVRLGA